MITTKLFIPITPNLRTALSDWRTLIQKLGATLTPVRLMVSEIPNYIIYTGTCKLGGGVLMTPVLKNIPYWVCK